MENRPAEALTINDIADQLGVSASTVSRAISGKGRIGQATRDKVLNYITEHNYHPNAAAQSLASQKTNNIAIIMPDQHSLEEIPFFHMCMYGAFEMAGASGYDLMVVTCDGKDMKYLDRLIRNRKVDGMIITRTYVDGRLSNYLKNSGIPFVAIGAVKDQTVLQIDHDHAGACKELTSVLIQKGLNNIAYLGGDFEQCVNQSRFSGFMDSLSLSGLEMKANLICTNLNTKDQIEEAVERVVNNNANCIICQDDYICAVVYRKLKSMGLKPPKDIKLASCYDGKNLEDFSVSITALKFDIRELGRQACRMLVDELEGSQEKGNRLLDYKISLRESTK